MPDALAPSIETDALATVDWGAMAHAERGPALAACVAGWRRRDVPVQWAIGRGLAAHRGAMCGAEGREEWRAYLAEIDMHPRMAQRLIRLSTVDRDNLSRYGTVDAALSSLRKPAEPAPTVEPEPGDPPAREPDEVLPVEPDPAALVEAEARESEPDPAAEREAMLERLAIRLQDEDGKAVDILHRKLEAAEKRERDERRGRLKAERERDGMKRALLKGAPSQANAAALAVLGIARKGERAAPGRASQVAATTTRVGGPRTPRRPFGKGAAA